MAHAVHQLRLVTKVTPGCGLWTPLHWRQCWPLGAQVEAAAVLVVDFGVSVMPYLRAVAMAMASTASLRALLQALWLEAQLSGSYSGPPLATCQRWSTWKLRGSRWCAS
jgi:hypothetical protein